jgi:hypothetical protein
MTSNAIEPSVKKTILRARRRASSLMRTASATCSEVAVVVFSRSASRSLLKTQFRCVIPTQESLPELPRRNRQMRAHHRTAVRRLPTNNRSFQRPLLRRILQHRRLLRDRPKLSVRRDQTGSATADYIQIWHGDANLLRESLEAVQQTAAMILGGIAPEVAEAAAAA